MDLIGRTVASCGPQKAENQLLLSPLDVLKFRHTLD